MSLAFGLDPKALHESGWGLLLPADLDANQAEGLMAALRPLLELRQDGAGKVFRIFKGRDGVQPGETPESFLARFGSASGAVDPNRIPYYLVIAAGPERISYQFQAELGVTHAVGRLWFDDFAGFSAYSEAVRRAETGGSPLPTRLAFFSPRNPDDPASQAMDSQIIGPLAERLRPDWEAKNWQVDVWSGPQATKAELVHHLAEQTPRLLFAAGHGLVYPHDHPWLREGQGGLVCADWPGPQTWSGPIPHDLCFQAVDVNPDLDLCGMLVFQYSSFSLGTPRYENFLRPGSSGMRQLAEQAFVARLPQRLLGLSGGRGALAMAGWIDRVWGYGRSQQSGRELVVLADSLQKLADGYPLGASLESFQDRYTEGAAQFTQMLEELNYDSGRYPPIELAEQWAAYQNARGLSIFGDPAVRLAPLVAPGQQAQVETLPELFTQVPPISAALPAEGVLDLEIRLSPGSDPYRCTLDMRLRSPEGEVETFQGLSGELPIEPAVRPTKLPADFASLPAEAYGQRLGKILFATPGAGELFHRGVEQAAGLGHPLHVSLNIQPGVEALQELDWEVLCDPRDGRFLFAGESLLLTRTLDAPPLLLKSRRPEELSALLAISNPTDVNRYYRFSVSVGAEIERAHQALQGIEPETLVSSPSEPGRLSLENLERQLRKGYDIVWLVCNAAETEKAGLVLFLEGADGSGNVVRAEDLIQRLRHMRKERRPPLVVLAPPQTRSRQEENIQILRPGALAGLAPRLAGAGLAVLSIPEGLSTEVAQPYLQAFFAALQADGQASRAAAAARRALYPRPGWWGPALFTPTSQAQLWRTGEPVEATMEDQASVLEILLARQGVSDYMVELRFDQPNQATLLPPVRSPIRLDFDALQAAAMDSQGYGARLFDSLFTDASLRSFYRSSWSSAQMSGSGLRLHLAIDASARELHEVSWERLFDPEQRAYLAMDEELAFSRFLFSTGWRAIVIRQAKNLRALLAVANPRNLEDYNLSALDEASILATAKPLERGMALDLLSGPVTLDQLTARLSEGYDLLYLVCHGGVAKGQGWLMLENEDHQATPVGGEQFVERMKALPRLPLLIELPDDRSASIAPALCTLGVPAVLAMVGTISLQTYQRFMPAFFNELVEDGRPGRAAAVARSTVSDRPDWWMPALFTRLKGDRLWRTGIVA